MENPAITSSVETTNGYQLIFRFEIGIDPTKKMLYIFSDKSQANLLLKRLKINKILEVRHCYLNLTNISKISNIKDEWGMWLDSRGQILKKAYFGTNLHKIKEDTAEKIISYDVSYTIKDEDEKDSTISLIISHEGRISSNSTYAKNDVLFKIFNNIKEATS